MKKGLLSVILIICLLLTTGYGGGDSGAVAEEAASVKDLTLTSVEQAYAVEEIDFPRTVWFDDSNIVKSGESIYLLGSFMEESFLYRLNADGSNAQLFASADSGSEFWRSYCADGDTIYIYDSVGNCLIKYDSQGQRLGSIALPDGLITDSIAAANGKIYVLGDEQFNCLRIDGEKAEEEYSLRATSPASVAVNSEGKVYVACQKDGGQVISVLDDSGKCWGETYRLDTSCAIIGTGTEYELYLLIDSAVYGYNLGSSDIKKIISFSDVGLIGNGKLCELGSGKYLYTGTAKQEAAKPFVLKPVDITEEKVTLTLATLGLLPMNIKDAVLAWNQSHPNITIEVRDYSAYSTDDDTRGGEYKLIADIAAGDGPDIFNLSDFDTTMNASLLARRGLLEDIYPFIDGDSELSREDFFSCALECLEVNGKLCQVTPGFLLLTTTASKQALGGAENLSYEQLEEIVAESDHYEYVFDQSYGRDDWLQTMTFASGAKLVDWENGQCYFDSEYFIKLLNMAASRPAETSGMGGSGTALIQNSSGLLYMHGFRDVWEAGASAEAYGVDNCSFAGFPEIGQVIELEVSLGMSSQSEHKEQCWQFLREFLLKDSPYPYEADISLRRDGAEQQMADELERSKQDPIEHPGRPEGMQAFLGVLENVSSLYQYDAPLWSIVVDETAKFYDGRATVEETAQAIQSRASIYIAEQQ